MYCLDNMTDSRAMSLLYALGIRERHQEISILLERLYSTDEASTMGSTARKDSPGDELAKIFSEELHVLAMNLGDEILDLTRKEVNLSLTSYGGKIQTTTLNLRSKNTQKTL